MAHHLLSKLIADPHSELWNEWELARLTADELEGIALLLGCQKTGTKEVRIVRILAIRQLRFKLAPYVCTREDALRLASQKRREDLRAMAAEAGIWKSGNKLQLAIGLLQWRDRCRQRGAAYLAEQQEAKALGFQLQLSLK